MKNTNSLKRSYMINKALTYFFLILGCGYYDLSFFVDDPYQFQDGS